MILSSCTLPFFLGAAGGFVMAFVSIILFLWYLGGNGKEEKR